MFSAWGKIKAALAIAVAVIVAIGIAFLRGRKAGIDHIEAEQDRRRLESMKQRKEVDDEIDALGAQDVDERLKRWNRVED